ncbi:unnamed protein product [Closterium sp. NIES-53]
MMSHLPFPLPEPGTNRHPMQHKVYSDFLVIDHCGLNDQGYMLAFVDAGTHYVWIANIQFRTRAYEVFRLWLAHAQRQSGKKLQIWQTDGAAEFRSKELHDYLARKGILHHISLPFARPQQGVAERTICTLMTKVRALLKQSNLPSTYWSYTLHHAMRVHNLLSTAAIIDNLSPHMKWTGKEGNTSMLCVWGPIQFDTWLDDLQLYLLSDSRDSVSLFDHTSGTTPAPPASADSATRSQWLTRDAAARLAIRNHLPLAECAHFGQHRHLEDLVSHLCTSNARYRAAVPVEFLDRNQPLMFITLYFIVTRLPDSLRSVRDHSLSLDPTVLTVDLLEQHLLAAETSVVTVGAARGTPRTPFFEGCSPSSLAPSYASAAAVDVLGAEDVGAASASAKRRSSKGKGGRGGGGGSGGGGGGSSSGGGGSGGGGSGGGSSGSGGSGSGGSGGGRTTAQRGGSRGGQRQSRVAIFDLDYDAILSAMYALSVSAEGDCYLCVPPVPSKEVVALGASESALPSTAPAEALHTFTLDSGASCCFFHDSTTLTPLSAHVPVRLAESSGGPVVARPSTVLPCPVVPSRSLSCLHLTSFSTNLVSTAALQDSMVTTTTPGGVRAVRLQLRERFFLLVVDDYKCYTTVFPLRSKGEVPNVLIPWIRAVHLQLCERFGQDLPVLRLHSDRGGGFSSDLLRDFCRGEGIHQSFTLPASPQQNGFAERRIGLVMEVARTSMIHAAAPHFLWPFAVQYAAHQLNLWPRVSLPETSPTLHWTGKVGDVSMFRFYHPTSRRVLPSQDVTFDESVPFYHPLPGTVPVEVAGDSGAASGGVGRGGAELGGAEPGGAEPAGVEPGGAEPGGVEPAGVEPGGAASQGADSGGAEPRGTSSGGPSASTTGDTGVGGAGAAAGSGGNGGAAVPGPRGARTGITGAAGTNDVGGTGAGGAGVGDPAGPGGAGVGGARAGVVDPGAGGAVSGGTGAGGTLRLRQYFVLDLPHYNILTLPSSSGLTPPFLCPPPDQSHPPLQPASQLPVPSPYTEHTRGLTERREPASRPVSPVRTACRVPRPRPPLVPCTHAMALRPSSVPLRVTLPPPPASSLPAVRDPASDLARAASPTVSHLLTTAVTDPSFESADASALVAKLVDFAAACRLDYATALIADSASASPPSVGGECALSTDVLEDRQEDFECLAATLPRFASMLLAPEGDPDAPDILTPRSYAEAVTGPYFSQWQAAMDAEMASLKSTGTYVDAVFP